MLPLATGGSPHHMLALDYALRPVLQSLSARHILPGVYATDVQIPRSPEGVCTTAADISTRLDEAVATLLAESFRLPPPTRYPSMPFSQVRCSV